MPDDKSPSSSMTEQNLTQAQTEDLVQESDKNVTMHLTGQQYSVTAKSRPGVPGLTLSETIVMWGYMTDWLLNRATELGKGDAEDIHSHVLQTLVKKITHECDAARAKKVEAKSPIIMP
jgi:hypothetical protein